MNIQQGDGPLHILKEHDYCLPGNLLNHDNTFINIHIRIIK